MRYNTSKCALDTNRCELLDSRIFNDNVCKKMNEINPFWTPAVQGFQPPLKCPIDAVLYTFLLTKKTDNGDFIKNYSYN